MDHSWRHMASAPKDGSRVIATIRSSEQGPAATDLVYWAKPDASGLEGWRSAESHPGCVIAYADTEILCWMPLPSAENFLPASARPAPFQGEEELLGSGI